MAFQEQGAPNRSYHKYYDDDDEEEEEEEELYDDICGMITDCW